MNPTQSRRTWRYSLAALCVVTLTVGAVQLLVAAVTRT